LKWENGLSQIIINVPKLEKIGRCEQRKWSRLYAFYANVITIILKPDLYHIFRSWSGAILGCNYRYSQLYHQL